MRLPFPTGTYGGIYADPPWSFKTFSTVTGMDRAAENHFATMSLPDMMALPVADIAAKNAVLALWATSPMLPQALHVMAAWGFTYKSSLVWSKARAIGLGYWFRAKHQVLLLRHQGPPWGAGSWHPSPSVLNAPRGRHSAKPEADAGKAAYIAELERRHRVFKRQPGDILAAHMDGDTSAPCHRARQRLSRYFDRLARLIHAGLEIGLADVA